MLKKKVLPQSLMEMLKKQKMPLKISLKMLKMLKKKLKLKLKKKKLKLKEPLNLPPMSQKKKT
jgi:hypothetical protein